MKKKLEEYFAAWDPMDFIKNLEAPKDEYSLEAKALIEGYQSKMNSEQVGELTYRVFIEFVESDYEGFREECLQHGTEIKSILDSQD